MIPPTPGQQWPPHTAPPSSGPQQAPPARPERPEDVITGFWLWAAAVPLLVAAYLISVVSSPTGVPVVIVFSVLVMVMLVAIVVTFLMLMRSGYRWARTVLTAGGMSSIFYVLLNLFTTERSTFGAVGYAVTGITGAVLVGGGIYLLHRPDAHGYLTR